MNVPQKQGHRAYLDGLRALAALWVVLSHVWIGEFGLSAHTGFLGLATNWTLYSHLAVDIFIVLSGFCLILPVAQAGGTLQGGAWTFFGRRARRILPPFYAALVFSVFVFVLLQVIDHQQMHLSWRSLATNIFLLQDVFLPRNIFNGPFWSIAVEWRIYFLFPLIVYSVGRWGWAAVLGGAALLGGGLTLAMFRWHPEMILACPWYLLLFTVGAWAGYQAEVGSGILSRQTSLPPSPRKASGAVAPGTAILMAGLSSSGPNSGGPELGPGGLFSSRRTWAALAAVSALGLCRLLWKHPVTAQGGADFGLHMPMIDVAAGLLTGACLFLMGRAASPIPLLSWRPLAFLGTFAYSLYLTHMPAMTLLRTGLNFWLPGVSPLAKVALTGMCLPLLIGLAYLFFLACERPFLRRLPLAQAALSLPSAA